MEVFGANIYLPEARILIKQEIKELSWICTDTLVGVCVYYFADTRELACASYKHARKDDFHYFWVNKEALNKFKEMVVEALLEQSKDNKFELINFNEDLSKIEEYKLKMDEVNKEWRKKHFPTATK